MNLNHLNLDCHLDFSNPRQKLLRGQSNVFIFIKSIFLRKTANAGLFRNFCINSLVFKSKLTIRMLLTDAFS